MPFTGGATSPVTMSTPGEMAPQAVALAQQWGAMTDPTPQLEGQLGQNRADAMPNPANTMGGAPINMMAQLMNMLPGGATANANPAMPQFKSPAPPTPGYHGMPGQMQVGGVLPQSNMLNIMGMGA